MNRPPSSTLSAATWWGAVLLACALLASLAPRSTVAAPSERVRSSLEAAELRIDLEPCARDVQRWVERALSLEPRHAQKLLSDAAAAGALPWVRLRGRFEDADRIERDELSLLKDTQQDTRWTAELWLEWDLSEAVAGPARFKAVKEARDQMELRQAVLHQATQAYHDRQRLLLEDALDVADDDAALTRSVGRRVQIRELDATLDALTSGRWGAALAQVEREEERRPRYRPSGPEVEPAAPGPDAVAGTEP